MLSVPQYEMLCLINNYGDMPPDAEDVLGIQGAAFAKVEGALIRKNLLSEDRSITANGWEEITRYRQRKTA